MVIQITVLTLLLLPKFKKKNDRVISNIFSSGYAYFFMFR